MWMGGFMLLGEMAFEIRLLAKRGKGLRVTARNVSLSTVDLPAAALHVQVVKRRVG
jgi:hypothetical protein